MYIRKVHYFKHWHSSFCTEFVRVVKVMEIDNDIFQDLEILEKTGFSKWPWKSFGFLFGRILKYPEGAQVNPITLFQVDNAE